MNARPFLVSALMFASAFPLGACGAKNVLHNVAIREVMEEEATRSANSEVGRDAIVRIYMDRDGSLYPGPAVALGLDSIYQGAGTPLRDVFRSTRQSGVWSDLGDSLNIDIHAENAWETIQDSLRGRYASELQHITLRPDGTRNPLVVLVHGFNVVNAEHDYESARDSIRPRAPEAVYLQVNWDGLVQRLAPPALVWRNAQSNFPLVGLGIRKLLNDVTDLHQTPVRVLTHSSGGPVIAHALWDASAAEGRTHFPGDAYKHLLELRADSMLPPRPAISDLRVAMIVPAGPAALFQKLDPPAPQRVIIGMNPDDVAVAKPFLFCSALGDTCLPVKTSQACGLRDEFSKYSGSSLLLFDFSTKGGLLDLEDHAWGAYMDRSDFGAVLDALLKDGPAVDEATQLCK